MRRFTLDIETDAIKAKVIHCIVAQNIDTGEILVWHKDTLELFSNWSRGVDIFVMHNGVSFDAPVLNELLGSQIPLKKIRDTLILSQLADASIDGGHSLDAWGKRLGFPKQECSDFSVYTQDMLNYCVNDVKLTTKLYKY